MRPKATKPSKLQERMMALALENQAKNEKMHTLESIGTIVAREMGRPTPFSKQRVKQIFERWEGWEGFSFDKFLMSTRAKRKVERYAQGGLVTAGCVSYSAIKKAGVPLRTPKKGLFVTVTCPLRRRQTAIKLSALWNTGRPASDIAKELGITTGSVWVQVCHYRKRFPDMFPLRQTPTLKKLKIPVD